MIWNQTYESAVSKAEHLIALGETTIHLDADNDLPWDKVTSVEAAIRRWLAG